MLNCFCPWLLPVKLPHSFVVEFKLRRYKKEAVRAEQAQKEESKRAEKEALERAQREAADNDREQRARDKAWENEAALEDVRRQEAEETAERLSQKRAEKEAVEGLRKENEAGGFLRTSTRPTLNILHLVLLLRTLRVSV